MRFQHIYTHKAETEYNIVISATAGGRAPQIEIPKAPQHPRENIREAPVGQKTLSTNQAIFYLQAAATPSNSNCREDSQSFNQESIKISSKQTANDYVV